MNKLTLTTLAVLAIILLSFHKLDRGIDPKYQSIEDLKKAYMVDSKNWPAALVDSTAVYTPLTALPSAPVISVKDQGKLELGKILFFDPRLSSSDKISCASCHIPSKNWADKNPLAIGHDSLTGKRNTPSIENVWIQKELFWDGRANSLQQQQIMSIENHVEMFQSTKTLALKIQKIKGYEILFKKAYGSRQITLDRILDAIALFQTTIVSKTSAFDRFINGDYQSLSDNQIHGLHLFRTKARCINCHNGPYFTDLQYHNQGFTFYKRKREDLGRYNITKLPEDVGKFKTPGLRNVINTGPWFHQGIFPNIQSVISMYNIGMNTPYRREEYKNDSLFPVTSKLLKPLNLTKQEQEAIIEFLHGLSSQTTTITPPVMP
ncbi:cytochrome-c peroxidase [Myroides pelagicus]|uniref:Cytochrome-c peroxidase n=1 Tax=Myroides pelagicus TaxID=270914 RepID=A0A7K1GP21_9FLAO|nr:cytochrome c peroxidase [Myroides pelagicus]MTH30500.1 cytochrome-c peroxidase [Myroides pelagicus]